MNRGVIVAASSDLAFATAVRDALGAAGIEIATEIENCSAGPVLVIWSSSLSICSEHLKALISLWAEERLTIARLDDTALPLGLGDLDSLPPGTPAERVAERFAGRIEEWALKAAAPSSASHPTVSASAIVPPASSKRAGRRGLHLIGVITGLSIVVVGGLFAYRQYSMDQDVRGMGPKSAATAPADSQRPGIVDDKEALERALAAQRRTLEEAMGRRSDERLAADTALKRPRIADDKEDTNARIAALELELEALNRQRRSEKLAADAASDRFAILIAVAIAGSVGATSLGFWAFRRRRDRGSSASTHAVVPDVPSVQAASGADPSDALFISYAHVDLQLVEPVLSELDALGRRVWIDRSEMTGAGGWAGQIVAAIKQSRAVVLMASPRAYASHHVVRELYLAMSNNKPIVPLELEEAALPDEVAYILAPFQRHALTGNRRPILARALEAV